MEYAKKAIDELAAKASSASHKNALVGLDGFVDKIMKVVKNRYGQGDQFEPMSTIENFGQRIIDASGQSANLEIYPVVEKLGGNGPIMAHSVLAMGMHVKYIGSLGNPIHSVFEDFAKRTHAVSLSEPGITHALEFEDGKLMLGEMAGLDNITYDNILNTMGEGAFFDAISRADLISLVNWTMIPNMTAIFEALLDRVLPNLGPKESGRTFYFDLADPAKRSRSDLKMVLQTIRRFSNYGATTLGLNFSEACQTAEVLDLGKNWDESSSSLKSLAQRIRNKLEINMVVVHPRNGAACANREDQWYITGPYCKRPKISTGAGDHFNAGFAVAQSLGVSPESCLTIAVAISGQYVRTGKSPSLQETARFIESWTQGHLSD